MRCVGRLKSLATLTTLATLISLFTLPTQPAAMAAGGTPYYPGISGSSSSVVNTTTNAPLPDYSITDANSIGWSSVIASVSTSAGTVTTTCASCTLSGTATSSMTITGSMTNVQNALNAMTLSGGAASVTVKIEPDKEFTSGSNTYYFWNKNGHYYWYRSTKGTRSAQVTAASTSTFAGVGGYMVAVGGDGATITTTSEKSENDFIGAAGGILDDNAWPEVYTSGMRCSSAPSAGATSCSGSNSDVYYWLPGGNAASSENAVAIKNTTVGSYPYHSSEPNSSGNAHGWSGWDNGGTSTGGNSTTARDEWDDWPDSVSDAAIFEYGNTTSFTAASITTSITLDTTSPTITTFSSSTSNGTYIGQQAINITATASENVTAGSSFVVTLNTSETLTLTAATTGTTFTGTYTVKAGNYTLDLTVSSYTVGTVTDVAGNAMVSNTVPTGVNNIAGSKDIVVNAVLGAASFTSVTATPTTLRSITANWASVSNVTSYTLKLYTSNDTLVATISGLASTSRIITTSDFAGIQSDTLYKVSIQAIGNGTTYGSSVESPKTSVTTNQKFTPTSTVSLPGSATNAVLNDTVTVTASLSQDGIVTFKAGGSTITGCSSVSSSAGLAICSWYPTSNGSLNLTADLVPSNTNDYLSVSGSPLNVTVSNGTSSLGVSLTASAIIATKGKVITITAATSKPGKVNFFWNNKRIPNCINKIATTSATCAWKPAATGLFNITATLEPTNRAYAASSGSLQVRILSRAGTSR